MAVAAVMLYRDRHREEPFEGMGVELGEVISPLEAADIIYGEPVPIYGRNTGDTRLIQFSVGLRGEGASTVQLATDSSGEPGVFTDSGQSIYLSDEVLPGGEFAFWARGVFSINDEEGRRPFIFVFRGASG